MVKTTLLLFSLSISLNMLAQSPTQALTGEYYLNGVMETASGFRINADSSFEFFFSQGALDRQGKGKFKVNGNSITFNSDSIPARDFALVSSKKQTAKGTTIRIADPNENILRYVFVKVKSGAEVKEGFADQQGYFNYTGKQPDSIQMMFEFCPEKISSFPIEVKDHNYFEFRFEPWLFDFFLKDFTLTLVNDELKGGHPMLEGKEFSYIKSKE